MKINKAAALQHRQRQAAARRRLELRRLDHLVLRSCTEPWNDPVVLANSEGVLADFPARGDSDSQSGVESL
jgi:hypothetical protein